MKRILQTLAVSLALATPVFAQDASAPRPPAPESFSAVMADGFSSGILTALRASPDHSTFWSILDRSGVYVPLANEDDFTVFAPTNAAFEALDDEWRAALLEDPNSDRAVQILLNHIWGQQIDRAEILSKTDGTPAAGQSAAQDFVLLEQIDGTLTIQDSHGRTGQILADEILADNGVIHVIDTVLLPGGREAQTAPAND